MKGFAVDFFIVHGIKNNVSVLILLLGVTAVNLRSCGHIQTFFSRNIVVVMNASEDGFFLIGKMTSRGAVRFVTNNQIKFSDGVDFLCLRLMNDINRLICGKDHSHSVFFLFSRLDLLAKTPRIGRCRICQFTAHGQ